MRTDGMHMYMSDEDCSSENPSAAFWEVRIMSSVARIGRLEAQARTLAAERLMQPGELRLPDKNRAVRRQQILISCSLGAH